MVIVLIALLLATVSPSWATTIGLIEETPGHYLIEGVDLDGVAALDITVSYDSTTLQLSTVTQGSLLPGMLFAGNPNQPGRVRIGAVGTQAISGSGTLARLDGKVETYPALILGFTAKLSDSSGRPLPVHTQYPKSLLSENLTQLETPPSQNPVDASSPSSISQRSSGLVSAGKVNLPAPWGSREAVSPPPSEKSEPYVAPPPEQDPRLQDALREALRKTDHPPVPYTEKQQVNVSLILELFETYGGPRTLAKMALLFNRDSSGLEQRPEILLADGVTSVEMEFSVNGGKEPSFALRNARLLWTGSVGEGRFLVRCIPEKGALSAELLFLGSKEMVRVPLTVVPPVSLAGVETLKEGPLPKLDLDADGKNTWRDDYILVANLLVQRQADKNVGASPGD